MKKHGCNRDRRLKGYGGFAMNKITKAITHNIRCLTLTAQGPTLDVRI